VKPILQIGKDGASDASVDAVRDAFNSRELLKVRILDSSPDDAAAAGRTIASGIEDAELVQVIGRTVVLFRADPDAPEIVLP
jgi:RNA-binding protein